MGSVESVRELICELCRNMYRLGWVSGTGGGMSIKADNGQIVMAPSGVQKERMCAEDMFVLDAKGGIEKAPVMKCGDTKKPKLSECAPLFMAAYNLRGAGAVLHSHSINALLATVLDETSNEFSVTQLETIKGIEGFGFYDDCVIPIIENTARESELTTRLMAAIKAYPKSKAVLVRRHGVYVWGKDWKQAKGQVESYDYLFEAAVKMRQLNISMVPQTPKLPVAPKCENGHSRKRKLHSTTAPAVALLDIEGTIAPVSYRTNVLVPLVHTRLRGYLSRTFETNETQAVISSIQSIVSQDEGNRENAFPPADAEKSEIIDRCCTWIKKFGTKKNDPLMVLQSKIVLEAFQQGELEAPLFDDVLPALQEWKRHGVKIVAYSSLGSDAQRRFFRCTQVGDIGNLFSGYFDTAVGSKSQPSSYEQIAIILGVKNPASITFVTDIVGEAIAAEEAGITCSLAVRPGNAKIDEDHGFETIKSLDSLTAMWFPE